MKSLLSHYFKNKNKKKIFSIFGITVIAALLVVYGQNCARTSFQEQSKVQSNTALSLSEEDEIWFRIESARIKIKQLTAISGFGDKVSSEVLEGKSPLMIAGQLKNSADTLEDMIRVKKMPTNSPDVIKKYTSLVDLLSNARDMLLAFYMNQGFAQSAKDLADAKSQLENSLSLLSSSFDSLQLSHRQLQSQVSQQGEQMTQMQRDFMAQMVALESRLEGRIVSVQNQMAITINNINNQLITRIVSNEQKFDVLQGRVTSVEQRTKEIEDQLKPQVEYLLSLAARTRADLDRLTSQFETIRTSGSGAYIEMVKNWNCSEDLIDKRGTQFLNLSSSVSEACVRNKEETLYSICVARYPTFCGPCQGQSMAQCKHWNDPMTGLSATQKLEILINIRQEIAIEYLNQQTAVHQATLFGSPSCNRTCLNINADGSLPGSCTVADLNQCGFEGQIVGLKVADANLAKNMSSLALDMNTRINALNNEFQTSKDYTNQRFAQFQTYVDQNLQQIRSVTEQRFSAIVGALNGIPVTSKPLYDQMTQSCLVSSQATAQAIAGKNLIGSPLSKVPGWDVLGAQAINMALQVDSEDILRVTSQSAAGAESISSIMRNLMDEVFMTLNMDFKNIPDFDSTLKNKISGVCPANLIKSTPFTNVVGRDPMEIIAIGVARRALMGDGAAQVGGVKTVFDKYQTPIVKGSLLQQAFFASILDYRADVSVAASQACLDAVDDFAKQMLSTAVPVSKTNSTAVVQTLATQKMLALLLSLTEQSKIVSDKLEKIQTTIIQRAVVSVTDERLKTAIQDVALKLIQASTLNVISMIKSNECAAFQDSYRAIVPASGQSAFDAGLAEYIKQKNALAAANENTFAQLNAQIAALQQANQNQQAVNTQVQVQIQNLQTAVGNLPTMQAVQAAIDALNIPAIKTQIDQLNNKVSTIQEGQFTPRVTAVRHIFPTSTAGCNANELSALAFPTSSQFNGGYLPCGVNYRSPSAANYFTGFWLKVWGSATKLVVKLNNNTMTGDYTGMTAGQSKVDVSGANVKLAAGTVQDGTFMINVANFFGTNQTSDPTITVTPYSANQVGVPVNYTFTLFSPLVLSFSGAESLQTVSMNAGVRFDLMGFGQRQASGWVHSSQGGLLAVDLNDNGRIDDGTELFGQATMLYGRRAENGFEALAQYDLNQDGVIDANDPIYAKLKVWYDLNQDGFSQSNELISLEKAGVTSISLSYKDVEEQHQMNNGNKVLYKAKFFGPKVCGQDGCTVFDVFFNNVLEK